MLISAVVFFALLAFGIALAMHGGPDEWGPPPGEGSREDGPPFPWFIPLFWLGFFAVAIWIFRRFRRTVEPIGDMMEAADRVAGGDYSIRVAARGPRDVRQLVHAFNTMTQRLEATTGDRTRLLADITHEVRTPLAVIQGTLEGMIDGVYERGDEELAPLIDQSRRIARLLEDLQTVATAEAGELRLHRVETSLADVLDDLAAAMRPIASRGEIDLVTESTISEPVSIDPLRMRQVLDNLVMNAIRYTPAGGRIEVTARSVDDAVEIVVRDTGRGMTPEDAARMFERFVKSADSGGSGLGLAIARSIVVAHGGEIGAASAPDAGTTVTIRLPVGK